MDRAQVKVDDTVVVGQTVALLSASAGSEEGTFLAGAAALEAAPTPTPKMSTVHTVQSVMASRKPMIRFPRRGAASASRIEPAVVLRPPAAAAAATQVSGALEPLAPLACQLGRLFQGRARSGSPY